MRVLLLDIETSPNVAHVWSLWGEQHIGLNQLLESTEMMCFAAKWLGDPVKKVEFYSTFHDTKPEMIQQAHRLLNEADVVMGWNSRSFDVKHLNREFLEAGLTPPSPYKQIDLIQTVKRNFRFPSNKLDYVSKLLGLGGKVTHEGHTLWIKCLAGDEAAWKRMQRYNKRDVTLLEELYDILQPWIPNHPNRGVYDGDEHVCPRCSSADLVKQGFTFTATGRYQQYQCKQCGGWSTSGKRIEGVDVRPVSA